MRLKLERATLTAREGRVMSTAYLTNHRQVRISRKEGQRFTACRSTVSHQVGPVLVRQDIGDFHSVTYAGQALDSYPRARARAD